MRRNNKHQRYYRLNYQITAPRIRLLDELGKQIGIVDKGEALRLAQAQEKDLVEIAPKAQPPVVKLIDFKKFKYLEAKREKQARKESKHVGLKEIRLSPFMGEHDFKIRMSQGEAFLKGGNQLRISVRFKGREFAHKEFGFAIINKAINFLQKISKVTRAPYFEGRVLVTILAPEKVIAKNQNETQNQKISS